MALPAPPARRRRRPVVVAAAALAAALGLGALAPLTATAQEALVIDDPRLDPSLAGVQVSGDGYQKALAAYRAVSGRLADAEQRLATATEGVDGLTGDRDRLTSTIAESQARRDQGAEALARHQASLRAVAVATYVQGRDRAAESLVGGVEQAATLARQDAMVSDVAERRTEQARAAKATIEEADSSLARAGEELGTVEERLVLASRARDDSAGEVEALRSSAGSARQDLADWRLSADVAGSDLPLVALDAYVKASGRMAFERPECGVRWSALAAIGKVESGHGTYGGSRITASGTTSQPILGIPLDGTNGTANIGDTDGGEIDGDPATDRAVGPMQFIPGSWRSLGRDGNGDGRADPSNIYDAALAAAGLLCGAAGSGLDTDAGLYRGALSYNNSSTYAALVVRTANAYSAREAELIPPPPTTTTTTTSPPAGPIDPSTPAPTAPGSAPTTAPPAEPATVGGPAGS